MAGVELGEVQAQAVTDNALPGRSTGADRLLPDTFGRQSNPMATIGAMVSRVIALFVAVALLWSGLSTLELMRPVAQPLPEQWQHTSAEPGGRAAGQEGSVEHHHLDDLPSQPQNDSSSEPPGLLPALPEHRAHALAMAKPLATLWAGARSPFLAGPLRPPCCSHVAG